MKNYRRTKFYKELTTYLAVGLAEGFEQGSQDEIGAAWQWLVDTGTAWKLQGWFGRTAEGLIEQGLIQPSKKGYMKYGTIVKGHGK